MGTGAKPGDDMKLMAEGESDIQTFATYVHIWYIYTYIHTYIVYIHKHKHINAIF